MLSCVSICSIVDPFLSIFVAMVFTFEVKLRVPFNQFQASLTKLSTLLQLAVRFSRAIIEGLRIRMA